MSNTTMPTRDEINECALGAHTKLECRAMLRRIADALDGRVTVPKNKSAFVASILEHYPIDANGMFRHISETRLAVAIDLAMLAAAQGEDHE